MCSKRLPINSVSILYLFPELHYYVVIVCCPIILQSTEILHVHVQEIKGCTGHWCISLTLSSRRALSVDW